MIAFWIVAGVLSAAAAGLVLRRAAAARAGPDNAAMPVYRRQLSEIEDLAARGLLAEPERKAAEAEAGRRLLAAAERAPGEWTRAGRTGALAGAALAPLAAAALYLVLGSPGYPDQPFGQRMAGWRETAASNPASLAPPEQAALLRARAKTAPDDPEAFRFLAMAEASSGDAPAAIRALRRAITLAPRRPDLWEQLGETLVLEAQGEATPQARAAFQQALALDPSSAAARFNLARARILDGDRAGGLGELRALQGSLPADDSRRAALAAVIAEVEKGPAPPAGAAPVPDMAAIQGMVAGLAARLEAQPDDPEGWVRLVRSYAVLGDAARRDAALRQARARFAGRPELISQLDDAARAEPMR